MDHAYDMKPAEAILELARVSKQDPGPLYKAFQQEVIGDLDKFLNMSPIERKVHLLEKHNEFLTKGQRSLEEQEQKEHAAKALESETTQLKDTLKVKDESIVEAKEYIKKNPEAVKKAYGENPPSIKEIIKLADEFERWDLAKDILTKIDSNLASDPVIMEIAVKKLQGHKHLPEQELIAAACQLFGKPLPVDPKIQATAKVTSNITTKAKQAAKLSDDEPRQKTDPVELPSSFSWDDL